MKSGNCGPLAKEFVDADFGDVRLNVRLASIVAALEAKPDVGFPQAFATEADTEAFYRFLANKRVDFESLLAPHVAATIGRMRDRGEVLVAYDTTDFVFGGQADREGLAALKKHGHRFHGHFALAVSADGRRDALGVLDIELWARLSESATAQRRKGLQYIESRKLPREQERWGRLVTSVEKKLGSIDESVSLIHVMDSEADDYELLAALTKENRRFVIRLCYDRRLEATTRDGKSILTKAFLAKEQPVIEHEATISGRAKKEVWHRKRARQRAREGRRVTLSITATSVCFRAPSYSASDLPKTLNVNLVRATEIDPSPDVEPVEWILITTESIESEAEILGIIDAYRARWVIEEFFRALKTGCAYETRQLESWKTLVTALGVFVPIAWSLLRLRTLSRDPDDASQPADLVLTAEQLEVLTLASSKPLPATPTVRDAMLAIARLGGHLRSNGDPGWQVLGRGYVELLSLVAGYRLSRRKM